MLYLFKVVGLNHEIIIFVKSGVSPDRTLLDHLFCIGWSNNVLRNMRYDKGFVFFRKNEVSAERWASADVVKEKKAFDEKEYSKMILSYWKQ